MQIELLRELMKLQKDMIIMLLSMLEGKQILSLSLYIYIDHSICRKCSQWSK